MSKVHDDLAELIAERDRLVAENERLKACVPTQAEWKGIYWVSANGGALEDREITVAYLNRTRKDYQP